MTYHRRRAAAEYLTGKGYIMSPATLATYASRGGGPPFAIFNGYALYPQCGLDGWAEDKISETYSTAVERRAAERIATSNVEAGS